MLSKLLESWRIKCFHNYSKPSYINLILLMVQRSTAHRLSKLIVARENFCRDNLKLIVVLNIISILCLQQHNILCTQNVNRSWNLVMVGLATKWNASKNNLVASKWNDCNKNLLFEGATNANVKSINMSKCSMQLMQISCFMCHSISWRLNVNIGGFIGILYLVG